MNKYKLEMMKYAQEFCRRLNDTFKVNISYVYKITIIQDTERKKFTVNLGIDINNGFTISRNKIKFLTYNEFKNITEVNKNEYFGDYYNASIIGKKKEEFTMQDLDKDFLELCNFNYIEQKYKMDEELE